MTWHPIDTVPVGREVVCVRVGGDHEKNAPSEWRGTMHSLLEVASLKRNFTHWADAPEPARVTDVRWNAITQAANFRFQGEPYFYAGGWEEEELPLKKKLHPSDIALIERCWAEGRLGEREVLFDQGIVGRVEWRPSQSNDSDGMWVLRLPDGDFRCDLLGPGELVWSNVEPLLTIHDPAQRARVRAIVAGMQKENQRPACVPADVTEWTRIEGRVVWRDSDAPAGTGRIHIHAGGFAVFTFRPPEWDYRRFTLYTKEHVPESLFRAARQWAGWEEKPEEQEPDWSPLAAFSAHCYAVNIKAGWHDKPREDGTFIALCHSELSECLEGLRKDLMDDKLPHRKMAEVELADTLIRIFDFAGLKGYDLAGAVKEKLAYNLTREDHKREVRAIAGGKKF